MPQADAIGPRGQYRGKDIVMETITTRALRRRALASARSACHGANPENRAPRKPEANIDSLGIRLDDEDRVVIAALSTDQRFVRPAFAPEWDAFP
jgi:hypothetical protein